MSDTAFVAAKERLKARVRELVEGKKEVGLSDLQRNLHNSAVDRSLAANGLFVAKMLNAIGWRRDGHMHTGYDRTPRYTRREQA